MRISELITSNPKKTKRPLTSHQQRIKSLQTQKEILSKQLKAERDSHKIQRAQQTIQSVLAKN
jgi:hypothetical protein